MKYSEKWGDSVEIAVALALQDLKLTEDQVTVTVLEEPSKGFFGIGSKLAKVRVEEKIVEKPAAPKTEESKIIIEEVFGKSENQPLEEVKTETADAQADVKSEAETVEEASPASFEKKRNRRKGRREDRPRKVTTEFKYGVAEGLNERPDNLVEQETHAAKTFLTDVAKEMGIEINVKVFTNDEYVYIDIDGPDSGTVIGKRGQTLDALQYLTSLVVNKEESGYTRVVIDAEGYREKREKTLEKLANRLADKAAKTGRSVRLEPMNPYERKVIHTALQSRPEVTTRSDGEEPYRRVIIEPVK